MLAVLLLIFIGQNSQSLEAAKNYVSGKEFYEKGYYTEAVDRFLKAIEIDSTFIDVYYNLGWALIECGKYERVITMYRNLLKKYPDEGTFYYILCWALIKKADYDNALKTVNDGLKKNPQNTSLLYTRGYIYYYGFNEVKKAERDLVKTLELEPGYSSVALILGEIMEEHGDSLKAREIYNRCLQFQSEDIYSLYRQAEIAIRLGKWEIAFSNYYKIYNVNPEFKEVIYNLALCQAMLGNYEESESTYYDNSRKNLIKNASSYRNLGLLYINIGLKKTAQRVFLDAIHIFPDTVDFYIYLAWLYAKRDVDSTILLVNMIKDKNIDDPSLLNLLGWIYLRIDSLQPAKGLFRKALIFDSTNHISWYNLGCAFAKINMSDSAHFCFQKCLSYNNSYVNAYIGLALIKENEKEYNSALQYYEKALKIDSLNIEVLTNLGYLYTSIGDTGNAINCFLKVINLDPDYDAGYYHLFRLGVQTNDLILFKTALKSITAKENDSYVAHFYLANVYFYETSYDSALIEIKNAMKMASEDPRIYALSGHINLQLNELDKALKDFHNAYILNPKDKTNFIMICDIKARIGQNQEAKKSLLDFLKSNPDFAPAHYTLAMIYVKENDYQKALNELKEYLRLEPDAVDRKQVEAMIKELEKYQNK